MDDDQNSFHNSTLSDAELAVDESLLATHSECDSKISDMDSILNAPVPQAASSLRPGEMCPPMPLLR